MNISVMYHSTTGNTKKVAVAISEVLGIKAQPISENISNDPVDLLFLGDGIYAGKASPITINFIKSLKPENVKNVAIFGTFGGQTKAIQGMKDKLKEQGLNVIDESFGCRGKAWLILNRKHPDNIDLNSAKEFAKSVLKKIN